MNIYGIDIGKVIIAEDTDPKTSIFGDCYLTADAVEGAFEVIQRLAEPYCSEINGQIVRDEIHLVSKCGKKIQDRSLAWLHHNRFFETTGVPESNVHFCLDRAGKAEICRKLGVTHFVDDRLEVLSYLVGIVPRLYLFNPNPAEVKKWEQAKRHVCPVNDWEDMRRELLGGP